MNLRCPECGSGNGAGAFYCEQCEAPLIPPTMIPPSARRYRIVLGDTCPICRAVSRIRFTEARPPQIPVAGCQDPDGCKCSLPIFATDLGAALAAPEPSLDALAPARAASIEPEAVAEASAPPEPSPAEAPASKPEPAPAGQIGRPRTPEWTMPAPITQQRRRSLKDLTSAFYQRRIQGIKIHTSRDCCPVCTEVAASIYEPSVAPPLPVVGCWHGWSCRCQYGEEPLPLDEHGHAAMRRLAQLEKERHLRRRKVAKGAPRRLHQLMLVLAVVVAVGPASQAIAARNVAPLFSWSGLAPLLLAVLIGVVAMGAMLRLHPLPSPPWMYALSGIGVAATGLGTLVRLHVPEEVGLGDLNSLHLPEEIGFSGLGELHVPQSMLAWRLPAVRLGDISASLQWELVRSMPFGERVLLAAGLAILILGVFSVARASDYRRREMAA